MTGRPERGPGRRAGWPERELGPRGRQEHVTIREEDMPDAVDDGIAVGVPPMPDRTYDDGGAGAAGGDGDAGGAGGAADGSPGDGEPTGADAILTDIAGLTAQRDEYLGALQRLQADFENYRKRVLRQQEEQSARAASTLVSTLLPVLDTLDLAEAHVGDDGSEGAKALLQARSQLLDTLAKEGLERVADVGVSFDPVVHDAVAHAPAGDSDPEGGDAMGGDMAAGGVAAHPSGEVTIDEVLRAGYRWRGQVLRPAMVRVRG